MTDMQDREKDEQAQGCGYAHGALFDASRTAWGGDGPRPVLWSVWYAAAETPIPAAQGAAAADFFDPGPVVLDAASIDRPAKGVILMSHGTGGTAESLGWIARLLVAEGYIVFAANHHGNTGIATYCPEGFVCWWERATDLSFLMTHFAADRRFGPLMGQAPVTAIGYSLGAYAALALAGGLTAMPQFDAFAHDHPAMARGPREFPDLADRMAGLFETSAAFRQSWARHSLPFRDARVSAAILLAPPPPVRAFTPASLASITLPVSILAGAQDREADPDICAAWLRAQNPAFDLDVLVGAGHYSFLGPLTPRGAALLGSLISGTNAQERAKMHAAISIWILRQLQAGRHRAQASHNP